MSDDAVYDPDWYKKPDVNFGKVTYETREGSTTQAYIDVDTGFGENRHSNIPVRVRWSDDKDMWVQVDDWEWDYVETKGFVRRDDPSIVIPY